MSSVPKNKRQAREFSNQDRSFRPGSGETHSTYCTILEVFDEYKLSTGGVPEDLVSRLEAVPGRLFAKVRLDSGKILSVPFADSEDQIYSTYGNAPVLEGQRAKIVYSGVRISKGNLKIIPTYAKRHVAMENATEVFDIGGLA